jgi:hypothetical protein
MCELSLHFIGNAPTPSNACLDAALTQSPAPRALRLRAQSVRSFLTRLLYPTRQTISVLQKILKLIGATGARNFAESMMTTIAMIQDRRQTMAQSVRSGSIVRQVLLACGILSSLLYVATDVLGGMSYEGYSFASQMISELMAIGAPSEAFVDPLFLIYGVLTVAFGVGVVREAAGRNPALRITGALVIGYAVAGLTGPTLFEMHQRGAGSPGSDTPHIVLTGVLVLFTLLAIGFGAFALGKRFRIYSFATLLIMIVFGALAGSSGARLAAGQPTPGFGILERINVYTSLLWMAVLAVALLRRPWSAAERSLP